jgi:hypothetical protein
MDFPERSFGSFGTGLILVISSVHGLKTPIVTDDPRGGVHTGALPLMMVTVLTPPDTSIALCSATAPLAAHSICGVGDIAKVRSGSF